MNKWQMDGKTLVWPNGGGMAIDSDNKPQKSIHPDGRSDEYRAAQRRRFRHRHPPR